MIICSFAAREPAKPLNDTQMCGAFLFYRYNKFFPCQSESCAEGERWMSLIPLLDIFRLG